jgi:hypothetical protein
MAATVGDPRDTGTRGGYTAAYTATYPYGGTSQAVTAKNTSAQAVTARATSSAGVT